MSAVIFLFIFCLNPRHVLFRDIGTRLVVTPPSTPYLNAVAATVLSLSEDELPVMHSKSWTLTTDLFHLLFPFRIKHILYTQSFGRKLVWRSQYKRQLGGPLIFSTFGILNNEWLANVWPIFELLGGIPQSEMTCSVLSVDANCRELKLIDYNCPFGYVVDRRRIPSLQIESTLSNVCRRAVSICCCWYESTVIGIRTAGNRLLTCLKYFISCNITPLFNFDLQYAVTKATENPDGLEVNVGTRLLPVYAKLY